MECQYETFNGLPVYYGGGLCDSKELEEYDTLDLARAAYTEDDSFDAPEGMDLMTYTHSRPDGGETRCKTVSWATPRAQDEHDRTSETDASDIEELDIAGFCRCPDLWEEEDPSVSSVGLHVNIGLDMSKQNGLNYVDVASMNDFDATGDNSDTGSVAELEWNTWDDACAWEFMSASENLPPELDLNPPAELLRNNSHYTDDDGSPEGLGHGGYVDGGIYPPQLCLWQQPSLWDSGIRNDDSMIIQRLNHKLTIYWHIDDMDSLSPTVCYNCMCLISLTWTMMSLSYGDGTVKWTGHDGGYDFHSWDIRISTAVFVLAVGYGWDDAISDEDQ